ncbi:hypothetical protein EDB89DRAFT_2245573 [Lactarius sanguifluus]|nr:hypothetical protein EDB89DRAFT_2245573 [Lactarius sanguifluus]
MPSLGRSAKFFAGVGVLLLAAKDVAACQDILADIFGRIEGFFVRLEIYTGVPLTPAMTKKMMEITVEALDILATATKEMEQGRAMAGLRVLEELINEEDAMSSVQLVKVTHKIDNKVTGIDDGVRGVNVKVQVVNDNVKMVGDNGKATATEVKSILRQTADEVDNVKRNQLRESLRKWQSSPDPSTNYNIAGDRQHKGTAEWFFESNRFENRKVTGSLPWVHSLIRLSTRSYAFCDILSRLYETHDNGACLPSDKALTQCLEEMLTLPNQGPVYLILDALDECPDTSDVPSTREQVLDLVKDLVAFDFLLSTSVLRVPRRSQTDSLQDERGQKKDLASYVRSVVYSGSGKFMKRWRKEDEEHVIETLSERADGMFQWVFCQVEVLRNCLLQNVRRVLRELPRSLDETYERVLREIGKANPDQT